MDFYHSEVNINGYFSDFRVDFLCANLNGALNARPGD